MTQRIKVMIRPKPLEKEELKTIMTIDHLANMVSLNKPPEKMANLMPKDNVARAFAFSKVFAQTVSQQEVYEQSAFSLVENVLSGYNGTIFAYGQTASGKTFTIMGGKQYLQRKVAIRKLALPQDTLTDKEAEQTQYVNSLKGIIPRAFGQIIAVTKSRKQKKHLIECSFLEIYNENVHDLLGEDVKVNLSLKENANKGLVIEGLKTFLVKSIEELERYLKIGYKNRAVRQTNMNKESSRSHCIFTIRIEEESTQMGIAKFKVGKLNLVDLAGSERQSKTKIKQQGMKQATKINLSLSALGKVINCLSNYRENQKMYIPYRDSKLTRLLQDSLGGNTKTVMIGTVSQQSVNYEQTLSTLIYASRAKFIQNSPVLNQDPKDVLLREYMQQIQKLKVMLMEKELENQGLKENTNKMALTLRTEQKQQQPNEQEEEIKKKIEDLQNLVRKDGQNQQEKRQLQKIEQLKIKIKKQEERQAELEKQQKIRQQELLSIEKDYKNLNQQVDILRNKFTDLKGKYLLKCEQLDELNKDYQQERGDFHEIIKNKNQHIKKLEKLLETVLEQQTYNQMITDRDERQSNSSYHSTKKAFPILKVESKAKINSNEINLFRNASENQKSYSSKKVEKERQTTKSITKPKMSKQNSLENRNYESQHEKKSKVMEKRSSYTNMKPALDLRERQQREKKEKRNQIKKVDSMISLKRDKSLKLPFITQVKKLSSSRKMESQYGSIQEIPSRISVDIARIKNEIIRELKEKSKMSQ